MSEYYEIVSADITYERVLDRAMTETKANRIAREIAAERGEPVRVRRCRDVYSSRSRVTEARSWTVEPETEEAR